MEIRYAHRHDAPGCVKISDEKVTINENSFTVRAYCLSEGITSQKIQYVTDIDLWAPIDPS